MGQPVALNKGSNRTKRTAHPAKTSKSMAAHRIPVRNSGITVAIQSGDRNQVDGEQCFLPLLFGLWNGYRTLRGLGRTGFGGFGGSGGFGGGASGFNGFNWMTPNQWGVGWPSGFGNGLGFGNGVGNPQQYTMGNGAPNMGLKGPSGLNGLGLGWPFMF